MQVMNLSFAGIHSTTNSLNDQTINGGLLKADNIVIDQPNVAKSRRGFKKYNIQNNESIKSLATYKSNLVVFTDDKLMVDNGSGTYTTLSSSISSPLSSGKIHYVEANKNFYYCDSNGVFKLDSLSSTPVLAGAPEALPIKNLDNRTSTVNITADGSYSVTVTYVPSEVTVGSLLTQGSLSSEITAKTSTTLTLQNDYTYSTGEAKVILTGTAVPNLKQVAYRVLFGYKDKNNNLILGAPSDRKIFSNNCGISVDVKGKVQIPKGIISGYFYQVYRSLCTDYDPNSNIDVTPSDELQLVLENTLTATDLSNGYFEFEDKTAEGLLGSFLYTNETQEGITQANYQPPLCQDVGLYKNCVFYANTKTVASFSTSLLATKGTPPDIYKALCPGDYIRIRYNNKNIFFTAVTTVSDPNVEFLLVDNNDPAGDVEATIKNFIECVNNYQPPTPSDPECPVYAFYSSSDSDIPGKFTLKAKDKNPGEISVYSDRPAAFFPHLFISYLEMEENKNRVYFSKPQQPEAVPLLNYIDVGSANYDIKRIIALRDSLFVLKSDGIYRISGESASSFTCKLFDGTTNIIASETAVAFNNMVYCVSDQGIVTISETGVSIISMPIENELFKLSEYANFSTLSFGIAYSSDRKYILFVPSTSDDTTCTQAFIYNSYTNTFVRWDLSRSCGVVRPNEVKQGELFLGTADGITYEERKDFILDDYCDDEYQVTIVDTGSYSVTLSSIPDEVDIGFTLKQGKISSIVVGIDRDNNELLLSNDETYIKEDLLETPPVDGTAYLYTPIKKTIEWFPITCNNPSFFKHFREITFMFLEAKFKNLSFSVYSDSSPDSEETQIVATSLGAWGYGGWGLLPWGGEVGGRQAIRSYIPLEKSRCRWLDLSLTSAEAFTQFEVSGISLMYSLASERDQR